VTLKADAAPLPPSAAQWCGSAVCGADTEAIIFSAANFGLFYAVLLGLLTIATFQSTKDLLDTIGREASDLSTLYRTADGYPNPVRGQLKGELRDYTRYVIDKDWPAHRRGLVLSIDLARRAIAQGDLRLYAWVQFFRFLTLPLLILVFPPLKLACLTRHRQSVDVPPINSVTATIRSETAATSRLGAIGNLLLD
jgi:hypothetical protein